MIYKKLFLFLISSLLLSQTYPELGSDDKFDIITWNIEKPEKIFRGKVSYKRIDKYVNLVRKTLDPDDYFDIELHLQDDCQFIRIEVWDSVLH